VRPVLNTSIYIEAFENRALRIILASKRDDAIRVNYTTRSFIICYFHQIKEEYMGGIGYTLGERCEMNIKFQSENLKGRDYLGDLRSKKIKSK
jgi:hypothetical protein